MPEALKESGTRWFKRKMTKEICSIAVFSVLMGPGR